MAIAGKNPVLPKLIVNDATTKQVGLPYIWDTTQKKKKYSLRPTQYGQVVGKG